MRDMPFVEGDRLRTENGRVEIQFPDGTALEVAENSLVEAVTPTRVRLLAGTMEHLQRPAMEEPEPVGAAQPISAPYLPQDLQTYGSTFDRYGSWQYAAPYGYVWYPTVAAGWRPYYNGYWSAVRRTGGRGSASTPGRARRITTAAGATRATAGSGFPDARGARRGCRGARRPIT